MKKRLWEWKMLDTGSKVFIFTSYVIMIFITLIVLLPLLYVLQVTFSSDVNYAFRIFPKGFSLMHYKSVFENGVVTKPLINSIFITSVSVVISMILTVMMAYPLSRKDLVGRSKWNFIVMLPMTISLGFLPGYMLVKDLGLMNSYWALIMPGAITTTNVIIMRNFFGTIPDSLIESAQLDGASEMRILFNIVVPLSKPSMATVAMFYMVSNWNEYFNVILYIRESSRQTLQVVLRQIVMANENEEGLLNGVYATNIQYTVVIVAMIPILMVYPFAQRYFTKGILMGSVKG